MMMEMPAIGPSAAGAKRAKVCAGGSKRLKPPEAGRCEAHIIFKCRRENFVDKTEILRIEAYLRQKFQLPSIIVRQRPQKDDSAEVNIGDEFIGIIFKDTDEGEVSYAFNMAILDIDLP